MLSSHSDSSTETYTVSGSSSTCVFAKESDEEMDKNTLEKSTEVEKANDGNESNSGANSSDENEIIIPEMTIITEENLPQIPTNRTIELNEVVDLPSRQNQNSPESGKQTEFDTVSEACNQDNSREASNAVICEKSATNNSASTMISESLSCEIPSEQTLSKSFSKVSNETTSDQLDYTNISNDTLIQSSSAETLQTELIHNPSQNIEPKSPIITTQPFTSVITAKSAAFQEEEVKDTSSSVIEDTNSLVSENNTKNFPIKANTTPVSTELAINANISEVQQLLQHQSLPPMTISESSKTSPTSSETSEFELAQTCATIPESLDNLQTKTSIPSKNSAAINFEVIPGGIGAGTPEIPKFVDPNVMEKDNSRNEIVSKEQQPNETVEVNSMTGSEVKKVEGTEVASDTVLEERQNSVGETSYKVDKAKPATMQFETPRKPAPSVDSRTITRPSKIRTQQLPEATVTPFSKTESESATADMLTANTGQSLPPPAVSGAPSYVSSQPPQILGQQSSIASRSQQGLPPNSVQQQVAASKPILQQATAPKIIPQSEHQQQPFATTTPMRGVTHPVVIPPNITPSVPVISTNPTVVSNAPVAAQGPHNPENSQREERKSLQRVRQRTVTVQSQISLDITAAYNEVKQMNSDDPATELVRRVQAIVATREKEWSAKNEKLTQLLAHEQKRNEPLEQKAAERLLAMAEYEKLVQEFVEELRKKNSDEKNCLGESKSVGRPGPERNLSPDDVTQLLKERDQLAEEVNSLETSYGELFRRYEKLRQTSVEIKRNEDSVKSASEEMARRYSLLVEKFEMLRRNAEEQLDLANNEIERLIKQHEADTLGLRLKVKHQESKIDSLTVSLEARQKELESMTAIFEEVITKAEANDAACDA
ncbi:Transforming acidic coiled-coil-containing protein (TACC) family protein [Acanthocheilonema viteae]